MADIAAGQQWSLDGLAGFEGSRLTVGAILSFRAHEDVICCSVTGPEADAEHHDAQSVTIPFLPLSRSAFLATVQDYQGRATLDRGFSDELAAWRTDPRGLMIFTVPFQGRLDHMIARQMAAVTGRARQDCVAVAA